MNRDGPNQPPSTFSHVCHTVVSDVAAAIGTEPEDLQPPLYDVIDTEALEQLFHRPEKNPQDPSGHITFDYVGCRVTVRSNGRVRVVPPEEATVPSSTTPRERNQYYSIR